MADCLFTTDGEQLVPTDLTVGPWSPDALHGGPVAALVMRAVEAAPAEGPFDVARLTLELVRPVPLRPLRVRTEVTRPGRNVQLVETHVRDGDVLVATARALRIRATPVPVPTEVPDPPSPPVPDPDAPRPSHLARTAFLGAVDLRFTRGTWDEPGPAQLWGRLIVPVVEGEEPSPRQQAAAIADFGNGISRIVEFDTHLFINPDLTVSFARTPEGAWTGLDTVTRLSDAGGGAAESLLFDERGPVGRSIQHLLVAGR